MAEATIPAQFAPLFTLDSAELAHDYDRISAERQFVSGQRLVQELAIVAGEHVLDVGCGTGLLAQHVADRVGPSGSVLGIDPLPQRIELARTKAQANLAFDVGDAYALDGLPDGGFDVVYLNAVFHWLPEKEGPLRQFARLLRTGGRLGISAGARSRGSPFEDAIDSVLSQPPYADYLRARPRVTFRVDEAEMRSLLQAAGFSIAKLETLSSVQYYATAEDAIRFIQASSFGNFLSGLPDALRPAARAAIAQALAATATRQGIPRDVRRVLTVAIRR
ncbi:MAG: class I SAM-dependent methyltransferase [Alphaproteobacteria bacterium]|nr:class I SAM-dependent methyltransferase [Alphaproteobacteria bacterium]